MELNVSGLHKDLEGKIPIILGTIPLANLQAPNTTLYTDVPPQPTQDPSLAPTQPVSPASPIEIDSVPAAANGGGAGWNLGTLYPSIRKF